MPLLAIRWTSRSHIPPPQVRGPAGRRPRLSASALHQAPDSADFVGIKTYLSPLPNRAVARYPGNAGKSVAELRDKFGAAALKWPDTGLQLPAR